MEDIARVVPPAEAASTPARVSHRAVLKGIAYGVVAANTLFTEAHWSYEAPSLTELPIEPPEDARRSVTIVSGGAGTKSGIRAAYALSQSYRTVGRICSLDYGSEINPEQNAQLVMDYVDRHDIEEVNYDGESMGLISTVAMFPYMRRHGAGQITNRIVADCSPVCCEDVRNRDIDANPILFDAVEVAGGFAGFAGKFGENLVNNLSILGSFTLKDVRHQLFNAWDRGLDDCSPDLALQEVDIVRDSTVEQFAENLSNIDYRQLVYLRPSDPTDDAVVNGLLAVPHLEQANKQAQKIRSMRGQHVSGAGVKLVLLSRTSHADPSVNPRVYNAALGPVLMSAA